jgi:hypothetical protein
MRRTWRLVSLLLWVLLPLPGLAQPASSEQKDPYGGYDDQPQEEEPQEDKPQEDKPQGEIIPRAWSPSRILGQPAPRIIVESLTGLTLGLVGFAPGAYLGFALAASESSSNSDSSLIGVIGLSFVGVTAGATLGVWGAGSIMGRDGQFLMTLTGAAIGALAGGFFAIPAAAAIQGGWVVPILTFPIVGAIIAYEMSDTEEHERKAAIGAHTEMVPVISVRPSGGLVAGLAGRF